jgi:hypothetical protein
MGRVQRMDVVARAFAGHEGPQDLENQRGPHLMALLAESAQEATPRIPPVRAVFCNLTDT